MGHVSKWMKDNKKILLKSGVLLGTSALDWYVTNLGISKECIYEASPVVNSYIAQYGDMGPYLLKAVAAAGGIFSMFVAKKIPEKSNLNGDAVFYVGTVGYMATSLRSLEIISKWPF